MKKRVYYIIAAFAGVVSIASAQNNTPWSTAGSIGIGTISPGRTLDVFGQARATYLWAGQTGANQDGRLYITDANGNVKIYFGGYPTESSYFASGNVGIGTATPSSLLQVTGPITAGASVGSTLGIDYLYGNYGNGKLFVLGSQYSSAASFLAYAVKAQSGATGYLSSTGITLGRSAIEANNGYIALLTGAQQASSDGGAVSITEKMRVDASGNVGIGTTNPTQKLSVNGTVRAKEVIVETTGWSDYVFSDDYKLEPLSTVEAKIKEQKRLPGMPSSEEVGENGVGLGEMQAKLLAKVEELTLHAIRQEKRIEQLEAEVQRLRK